MINAHEEDCPHQMTPFRRVVSMLFALCIMVPAHAHASNAPEKLADPRLEARAVALQKELRCVVCQGQSLDESNAPLAADLRRLIRTHIELGESDT
jgi:cytochrome c-type biogenesis protein CcmH